MPTARPCSPWSTSIGHRAPTRFATCYSAADCPLRSTALTLPKAKALLREIGRAQGPFPVLVRYDGQVLTNPTNEQIAQALGVRHASTESSFDVVVVGAGPAGLSAAVYAASEGLRTIVVDRESIGGQAGTSSLIRNYLGFPLGVSGADLCNRALDQAWAFGAETSVLREVTGLRAHREHLIVELADGAELAAQTVVLATGASYQRLGVPRLEASVGAGVFYGGGITEATATTGQHVVVVGAETSMSGVFAAGDIRHGSVKRVASAVGEGSISIRSVHEYLSPLI